MSFQPWQLSVLEEYGYMDSNDGLINRLAWYLAKSANDVIGTSEFRELCIACGVDPDSFTQSDLNKLQN